MNYSNHILDYSKYNYICLHKAGSQPLFRGGLVVHQNAALEAIQGLMEIGESLD